MSLRNKEHSDHGEGRVVDQQFEADPVVPRLAGPPLHEGAQHGGRNGDPWHPAVADAAPREEAEEEHAEDRPVGIAGDLVDQVDDAVVGQVAEGEDHTRHGQRHEQVHAAAQARQPPLVAAARTLQDIDRKGGGEGREGRSGGRIGARDEPDDEQDADNGRQSPVHGHQREDLVALGRKLQPGVSGVEVEQHAEDQEEEDHEDLADGRQHDVLLRVARRGAAQVALHHVLVEAGHGHQQHDACGEHLPEIAVRCGVVEEEDARHGRIGDGLHHPAGREAEPVGDEDDREDEAAHQADGLERVGPDERLHAALLRIEPDEGHRDQRVGPQRQAVVVEDQQLEHRTDNVDAQGGAQHLRDEEEPGARAVRMDAEAVVEVLVERDDPQPVKGRDEQEGHDKLPDGEARNHLHVGERIGGHRTGDRDEGHARHGGADHGEGRHVPRGAAPAGEEPGVVGPAAREPCDEEEDGDIAQDGGDDGCRCHGCGFGISLRFAKDTKNSRKNERIG